MLERYTSIFLRSISKSSNKDYKQALKTWIDDLPDHELDSLIDEVKNRVITHKISPQIIRSHVVKFHSIERILPRHLINHTLKFLKKWTKYAYFVQVPLEDGLSPCFLVNKSWNQLSGNLRYKCLSTGQNTWDLTSFRWETTAPNECPKVVSFRTFLERNRPRKLDVRVPGCQTAFGKFMLMLNSIKKELQNISIRPVGSEPECQLLSQFIGSKFPNLSSIVIVDPVRTILEDDLCSFLRDVPPKLKVLETQFGCSDCHAADKVISLGQCPWRLPTNLETFYLTTDLFGGEKSVIDNFNVLCLAQLPRMKTIGFLYPESLHDTAYCTRRHLETIARLCINLQTIDVLVWEVSEEICCGIETLIQSIPKLRSVKVVFPQANRRTEEKRKATLIRFKQIVGNAAQSSLHCVRLDSRYGSYRKNSFNAYIFSP